MYGNNYTNSSELDDAVYVSSIPIVCSIPTVSNPRHSSKYPISNRPDVEITQVPESLYVTFHCLNEYAFH